MCTVCVKKKWERRGVESYHPPCQCTYCSKWCHTPLILAPMSWLSYHTSLHHNHRWNPKLLRPSGGALFAHSYDAEWLKARICEDIWEGKSTKTLQTKLGMMVVVWNSSTFVFCRWFNNIAWLDALTKPQNLQNTLGNKRVYIFFSAL